MIVSVKRKLLAQAIEYEKKDDAHGVRFIWDEKQCRFS